MSELLQPWFERAQSQRSGLPGARAPWLASARQRALDRFMAEGWPTTRHKDWRHTSLAFLQQQKFDGARGVPSDFDLEALRQGQKGHWMVFVDGRFEAGLSRIGSLPEGVRVAPLAQVLAGDAAQLEADLGEADEGGSPAALNLALAGALLQAGMGYFSYAELADRMDEVAAVLLGEGAP